MDIPCPNNLHWIYSLNIGNIGILFNFNHWWSKLQILRQKIKNYVQYKKNKRTKKQVVNRSKNYSLYFSLLSLMTLFGSIYFSNETSIYYLGIIDIDLLMFIFPWWCPNNQEKSVQIIQIPPFLKWSNMNLLE